MTRSAGALAEVTPGRDARSGSVSGVSASTRAANRGRPVSTDLMLRRPSCELVVFLFPGMVLFALVHYRRYYPALSHLVGGRFGRHCSGRLHGVTVRAGIRPCAAFRR